MKKLPNNCSSVGYNESIGAFRWYAFALLGLNCVYLWPNSGSWCCVSYGAYDPGVSLAAVPLGVLCSNSSLVADKYCVGGCWPAVVLSNAGLNGGGCVCGYGSAWAIVCIYDLIQVLVVVFDMEHMIQVYHLLQFLLVYYAQIQVLLLINIVLVLVDQLLYYQMLD